MRPFLSEKQLQIITQALVMSSLDYCNTLDIGANQPIIKQLQNLQNRAARVIKGLKRKDDVTPYLEELHWLKVKERIKFKILLLVFKCIYGLAPKYLSDLIIFNTTLVPAEESSAFIVCHTPHLKLSLLLLPNCGMIFPKKSS
jgi:hypothetical protein